MVTGNFQLILVITCPLKFSPAVFAMAALTGCGKVNYDDAKAGTFKGQVFVMWLGEGSHTTGGGQFLFVPNPRNPLKLIRQNPNASVSVIQPGMMYTDGGSIPKLAQVFKGFSPWGYAPAYMVHDWLFVARHCLRDGTPENEHLLLADVVFQESADIITESIVTLVQSGKVQKNDVAKGLISSVVAGPFTFVRWQATGECETQKIHEDDRKAAEAAIPGSSRRNLKGLFRTLDNGVRVPLDPATIVGSIEFK